MSQTNITEEQEKQETHQGSTYENTQEDKDAHKSETNLPEDARNDVLALARTITSSSPGEESVYFNAESFNNSYIDAHYSNENATHPKDIPTSAMLQTFLGTDNPKLDPHSKNFSPEEWIRAVYNIITSDPDKYKPRYLSVAFKNLNVYGYGSDILYQKTVSTYLCYILDKTKNILRGPEGRSRIDILRNFEGLLNQGDLLIVLGRPGSGCTTFLKTLGARTYGFKVDKDSQINYKGITQSQIRRHFRGEVVYNAEDDNHLPNLTVGQTLLFASKLRVPHNRFTWVTRKLFAKHLRDVIMAMFGLSRVVDTKVGNDYIRGVSGGERKRVSIAEISLCGAPFQLWDNSTRGLDSANAFEFVKALKISCDVLHNTAAVAIYQASEDAYNLFNKVILLYEGYEIYFGPREKAKDFFTAMGFECSPRQTTPDFLTSLTNPVERIVKKGYENKVPRTAEEFAERWKNSNLRQELLNNIDAYLKDNPIKSTGYKLFRESHHATQAKGAGSSSSYTVNFWMQVKALTIRGFQNQRGDMSVFYVIVSTNLIMGLIIGSMFYNMRQDTSTFYFRSSILFFALLYSSLSCLLEIVQLFVGRKVVEKHHDLALYRPAAYSLASIIVEIPTKIIVSVAFNLSLYFLSNLRRTVGHFFVYFLISMTSILTMSHLFRTIGTYTKSLPQAFAPGAIVVLAMTIYTGFIIPTKSMHGWGRWINYINPLAYAYEAMIVNEFGNRQFECAMFVPSGQGYSNVSSNEHICSVVGASAGLSYVEGNDYLSQSFRYYPKHLWRDWGILFSFSIFFLIIYLISADCISGARSKGEFLIFPKSILDRTKRLHKKMGGSFKKDEESNKQGEVKSILASATNTLGAHENAVNSSSVLFQVSRYMSNLSSENTNTDNDDETVISDDENELRLKKIHSYRRPTIVRSESVFHWRDVCYNITLKQKDVLLLDKISGWVKPGTLTALMGASGAGKTTLLNVLANRVSMGVISGKIFVDGKLRDDSFQRSTGYVQQEDLHLSTATVREALEFSAVLRQSSTISKKDKLDYVEEVIKVLEMEEYADAIVGERGEGLNVEQRKRLSIGVELAARPKVLLFLDEPTSGLDSQTSWSICQLLRKLALAGQAILCTIHQPSAILFQHFDRLLFLQTGGKTVYFGDIGENSKTLISYFEKMGADPCPAEGNPAEWMLTVVGAAPGSVAKRDYHEAWIESSEYQDVLKELDALEKRGKDAIIFTATDEIKVMKSSEYAQSFFVQFYYVIIRVWQQYWRSPRYIYAKLALSIISALFNGFSFFKAENTLQGMQNMMLSVYMYTVIFTSLITQMLPQYLKQRDIFEVRESPSKTYSWAVFICAELFAEIPWQIFTGTLSFLCWYFPIGFYTNAEYTNTVHERGGLMFLYAVMLFLMSTTMGHMCIAGFEREESAGHVAHMIFTAALLFSGVLITSSSLPRFWIFMYRVSPLTYFVSGMLSSGIGNSFVKCASEEYLHFNPSEGSTCAEYLNEYIQLNGGYLSNPDATSQCSFCTVSDTSTYLAKLGIQYSDRWWHMVLLIAYILFNGLAAVFLYWLIRVPKNRKIKTT